MEKIKLFKLAIFFIILVNSLLTNVLYGQVISDDEVKRFIAEIPSESKLKHLIENQKKVVARKQSFLDTLQKRLEASLNETESKSKKRRVSTFAYEVFVGESRLADEEIKLWRFESLLKIRSKIDTTEVEVATKKFITEFIQKRQEYIQKLKSRASEIDKHITNEIMQKQFNEFISHLDHN